jgi:hypothetical protein
MAHFAHINDDGIVRDVIVISNADCGGGEFPDSEPIGQAFINGPHPDGLALDGRMAPDLLQRIVSGMLRRTWLDVRRDELHPTGRPRGHAMSWKLAAAAVTLRDQVNKRYPRRDRASDGTNRMTRHTRRRRSDHNPDKTGYVMALDLDEDGWPQAPHECSPTSLLSTCGPAETSA